mgnify:CR=1 FL=1|tara:strand:+ start:118 stop:516 length:399 start_codon:yes stop_codon:yes gene_type:complete
MLIPFNSYPSYNQIMKKLYPLLFVLFLISIGFGQQLIPQITENYDNGNVKRIVYHKHTQDKIEKVKIISYWSNGQKKLEINLKDEKLNGLYTRWYYDGQKIYEGTYRNDEIVKLIGRWNKDGSVKKEPYNWE